MPKGRGKDYPADYEPENGPQVPPEPTRDSDGNATGKINPNEAEWLDSHGVEPDDMEVAGDNWARDYDGNLLYPPQVGADTTGEEVHEHFADKGWDLNPDQKHLTGGSTIVPPGWAPDNHAHEPSAAPGITQQEIDAAKKPKKSYEQDLNERLKEEMGSKGGAKPEDFWNRYDPERSAIGRRVKELLSGSQFLPAAVGAVGAGAMLDAMKRRGSTGGLKFVE